jgi:hypothetical protein
LLADDERLGGLPAEERRPGLARAGLEKLFREERLRLWVGRCGVLGGEGRSK